MALSKDPRLVLRDFVLSGQVPSPGSRNDAETLAATAREQGLVGILHTGIHSSPGPDAWPRDIRDGLRDTHRALLVRGIRQLEQAGGVQDQLLRQGLRVLPLKGAAIAESLYDSVADRPMADIDLLALDDWLESVRVLQEMGFRETARGDHARAFVDPSSGTILELHHALTSCPGLFPIDREGLWRRSRRGSGALGRLPSPEDLLVHLSLHASFQHGLVLSLVQYLDFRRLYERLRPDPGVAREAAANARAEPSLGIAGAVAAVVVGAPEPALPLPHALAAWCAGRLDHPTRFLVPEAPALARVRWDLAAGQRLRLVMATVASPEPGDRRSNIELCGRVVRRSVHLLHLGWRVGHEPRPAPSTGLAVGSAEPREPVVVDGHSGSARPETGVLSGIGPLEELPADGLDGLREAALRACLWEFPHVRLTVSGDCMRPVLRPGQVALLARPPRPARVGSIVLVRAPAGLRLHRVLWGPPFTTAASRLRTKGDRSLAFDPPLGAADVLGVVIGVEGGGPPRGTFWRMRTLRSLMAGLYAAARGRVTPFLRATAALGGIRG